MDDRPQIRILHNMARSGGTLVSRCLAAMHGVALLSEIHPLGARHHDPLVQARDWYRLLTDEDVAALGERGSIGFADALALIAARAADGDLALIVRDWAHLDVIGVPFLPRPTGGPVLVDVLTPRFTPRRAALVRHPLDQWVSLARLPIMGGWSDVEAYLDGYLAFARMAAETGFVRYEDVTLAPDAALGALCALLDVPFDPGYRDRFAAHDRVTGDTAGAGRAAGDRAIRPLARRPVAADLLRRFERHPAYAESLALLGYDPA